MAAAGQAFDFEEKKAEWPERMMPHQLARLQKPFRYADKTARDLCFALGRVIKEACEAGQLPHTVTTEQVEVTFSKRFGVPMGVGSGKLRTFKETGTFDSNTYHIEAAPFADWLRKQGEEPSQHIAHWFKVRGVAAPAVLQLTPPAPAIDAVVKPADSPPKLPTTWAELVRYHKANPGHPWTVGLKNIVAAEKNRRTDALHAGAAKAMAGELGVTVSMLNTLIAKKDEIGSRKTVANRRTGT